MASPGPQDTPQRPGPITSIRLRLTCPLKRYGHFVDCCQCSFNVKLTLIGRFMTRPFIGLRKEWICSERPITICPIVTCWTHARRAAARGHVGTRTNQGSRFDYITKKPYLHHQLGVPRAPILA